MKNLKISPRLMRLIGTLAVRQLKLELQWATAEAMARGQFFDSA